MDRHIILLDGKIDDDLVFCENEGIAYQTSMKNIIEYSQDYYNKYLSYEDSEIARKLNEGRISFVNKFCKDKIVLDIGIGSGEFIKKRGKCLGYDVNKFAVDWLIKNNLYCDVFVGVEAFTFWDVIEHVECPADYFTKIADGSYVFVSIPIFENLSEIRNSKHYRPDEHLYYFTRDGFVNWMKKYYFVLEEESDFEIKAGREGIISFCFRKDWYGDREL